MEYLFYKKSFKNNVKLNKISKSRARVEYDVVGILHHTAGVPVGWHVKIYLFPMESILC